MAVLGLDSTLVFFNFRSRLFEHFHVDDVVTAVHARCPVPANEHSDILRNSLSRHIANARSPQIVEVESDVFRLLLRVAHLALAAFDNDLLTVSTLETSQSCPDASVPPSIPKILHWYSIRSGKYEVVRLLTTGAAHEDTH